VYSDPGSGIIGSPQRCTARGRQLSAVCTPQRTGAVVDGPWQKDGLLRCRGPLGELTTSTMARTESSIRNSSIQVSHRAHVLHQMGLLAPP
jgi:hypothetical protein